MNMSLIKVTFCVLVSIFSISQGQNVNRPLVQLSTGQVRGWPMTSKVSTNFIMNTFRGIPYAEPPVGPLRFKAPVAAQNWTGVKELSDTDPLKCPQSSPPWIPASSYSEDCLYINVYSPQSARSGDKLPVMVWIYGGALSGGSSAYTEYGPDYLVEQKLIFVSFNYRVGALGFLYLGTDDAPGNAGLKDQNLAIRWVKKEISNFGGDPEKVTLFGESAGSTSVSFQYISPLSQGLFSKAICESGNAFSETTFLDQGIALERAKTFAGKLNCTDSTGNVNTTCLQNANVSDYVQYQTLTLTDEYKIPGNQIVFPATVEKNSSSAILPDTPENLLDQLINSNATRVPLIMGVNHDEGTLQLTTDTTYYSELHSKLKYFIRTPIRNKKSASEIDSNVASIYSQYFNNTAPSLTNLDGYIKLYGDKMFAVYTAIFARKLVNLGNVFLYHFDYNGNFKNSNGPASGINVTGKVGHGAELNYIFYKAELNQTAAGENSTDLITLRRLVKMWTNFAIYGDPTPDGTNDTVIGTFKWNSISNSTLRYMRITDQIEMSSDDFLENEVTFWKGIETVHSFSSETSPSALVSTVGVVFNMLLCRYVL